MTILHKAPIIAKLEKDGVDTVRVKLGKGLYRKEKETLIKEWLAEQEGKSTVELTGDPDEVMVGGEDPKVPDELDPNTIFLANKTDEEYANSDTKTKRAITRAKKKVYKFYDLDNEDDE